MEEHPNCDNVLEREKYHSMLNMDVLPVPDSEMALTEDEKEYEDPTKIFVKSRVTVCMLTLSVVTLSVCLISVIFFVRLEDGLQHEEAIYVLGKLFFFNCFVCSNTQYCTFSITCKKPTVHSSWCADQQSGRQVQSSSHQHFPNLLQHSKRNL